MHSVAPMSCRYHLNCSLCYANGTVPTAMVRFTQRRRHMATGQSRAKRSRNSIGERWNLRGKHSPHSWRSVFSTWGRDAGKDADAVEAQLDHVIGTKQAAAYDRAKRLEIRRALMAWYERQLLTARDGAKVVPLRKATPLLDRV